MSAKPIDTTHALLEAAAQMLEAHGADKLSWKIYSYTQQNIPDVPLYGEEDPAAAACLEIIELQRENRELREALEACWPYVNEFHPSDYVRQKVQDALKGKS